MNGKLLNNAILSGTKSSAAIYSWAIRLLNERTSAREFIGIGEHSIKDWTPIHESRDCGVWYRRGSKTWTSKYFYMIKMCDPYNSAMMTSMS